MEKLILKSQEFYLCALRVNYEGMKQVINECHHLVQDLIKEGKTYDDVIAFIESVAQKKVNPQDVFLAEIKELFKVVVV